MRKCAVGTVLALITAIGAAESAAVAQAPMLESHTERVTIDSGPVVNGAEGGGVAVIFTAVVEASPGAPWVRLAFDSLSLAPGAYLQITSVDDGAVQRLDAQSAGYWSNTSAYFNGDAVLVELCAGPGTSPSRVSLSEITVGDGPAFGESICGTVDDRLLSMDPRAARLAPALCTAWLIDKEDKANRFLTAGHCMPGSASGYTVNFNVPLSTSSGSYRFPGPENQYAIDPSSSRASDNGPGNDYCTFQTFPNASSGLHARQAQDHAYTLIGAVPSASGQTLTMSGFGGHADNVAQPRPLSWRYVQATSTGPFISRTSTTVRHGIDSEGGNSGGPVTGVFSGQERAIAIHTSGGCLSGNGNSGTRVDHPSLQSFLNNPVGLLADYRPLGRVATTMASQGNGSDGGVVYFNITTGDNPIRVPKLHLNLSSDSIATSFTVNVYTTPGGYEGKTSGSGPWTLSGRGGSSTAAVDEETIVPLAMPFELAANTTYGIALDLVGPVAHRLTLGANTYTDGQVTIETGASQGSMAGGTLISPATFNGVLAYERAVQIACLDTIATPTTGLSGDGTSIFLDLTPISRNARVMSISCGTFAPFSVNIDIYTRNGSYVGNADSPAGWSLHGSFGGVGNGQDFDLDISHSPIELTADETTGLCLVYRSSSGGLRFQADAQTTWTDGQLALFSDLAKASPIFTGTSFTPRTFSGTICYEADDVIVTCEADCNEDEELDLFDILCFLNNFNAADPGADCNEDEELDLFDILCFLNVFNAGC